MQKKKKGYGQIISPYLFSISIMTYFFVKSSQDIIDSCKNVTNLSHIPVIQ